MIDHGFSSGANTDRTFGFVLVVIVVLAGVGSSIGIASAAWAGAAAVLFVIARVLYLLLYWTDLAWQRSLVWVVGLLCSLLLMLSPALA